MSYYPPFDPSILSTKAGAQWFKEAIEWYRNPTDAPDTWSLKGLSEKENKTILRELLELTVGDRGEQMLRARPDHFAAAKQIFNNVIFCGPEELYIRFNSLFREQRLFVAPISRHPLIRERPHIRLDLKTKPTVQDGKTLRSFLLAVLAANPSYHSNLREVGYDDETEYIVAAPDGIHTVNISRLVTMMQLLLLKEKDASMHNISLVDILKNHRDKLPDREDAWNELLFRAGFKTRDYTYESASPPDRNNLDELYLSMPSIDTRLHGIELSYVEIERNHLPASFAGIKDSLLLDHRGRTFVITDALKSLPLKYRAGISKYFALLAVGHRLLGKREKNPIAGIAAEYTDAIRLMFAAAELDGRADELVDIFLMLFPKRFVSLLVPNIGIPRRDERKSATSWNEAISGMLADKYQWPPHLMNDYAHLTERIANGYSRDGQADLLIKGSQSAEAVFAASYKRIAHAFFEQAAENLSAMMKDGSTPSDDEIFQEFNKSSQGFIHFTDVVIHQYEKWLHKDDSGKSEIAMLITGMRDVLIAFESSWFEGELQNMLYTDDLRALEAHVYFVEVRKRVLRAIAEGRHTPEIWNIYDALIEQVNERMKSDDPSAHIWKSQLKYTFFATTKILELSRSNNAWRLYRKEQRLPRVYKSRYTFLDRMKEYIADDEAYIALRRDILCNDLNWSPQSEISRHVLPLLTVIQEKLLDLSGGVIPEIIPGTNRNTTQAPLDTFVQSGSIEFSKSYTPISLRKDLELIARMERDGDDYRHGRELPQGFEEAYYVFAADEFEWTPIDQIEDSFRPLVEMVRTWVISTFGGKLPTNNPITGQSLKENKVHDLIRQGNLEFTASYTAYNLLESLKSLIPLRLVDGEIVDSGQMPNVFEAAYEKFIVSKNNERDINEFPEYTRPLIALLRTHILGTLGGRLFKNHPINGTKLKTDRLKEFLHTGEVNFTHVTTPHKFRLSLLSILQLNSINGSWQTTDSIPKGFDGAYAQFIAGKDKWRDADDVAHRERELVHEIRTHVLNIFGGRLPKKHPLIHQKSLFPSPLNRIITDAKISLHSGYTPQKFRKDLIEIIFSVGLDDQGKYTWITPSERSLNVMDDYLKGGDTPTGGSLPQGGGSTPPTTLRSTVPGGASTSATGISILNRSPHLQAMHLLTIRPLKL